MISQPTACNSVLLFQSDRHKFVAQTISCLVSSRPAFPWHFFIQCNLIDLFFIRNIVSEMQEQQYGQKICENQDKWPYSMRRVQQVNWASSCSFDESIGTGILFWLSSGYYLPGRKCYKKGSCGKCKTCPKSIFSISRGTSFTPLCLFVVFLEEAIQRFLLANGKFTGLDTRVVYTKKWINVVHRLRADVSQLLDLGRCILDLQKKGEKKVNLLFYQNSVEKNGIYIPHRLSAAGQVVQHVIWPRSNLWDDG